MAFLPHIQFQLGRRTTDGVAVPAIWTCIDSGDGANVGYLACFEALVVSYPEVLEKIYTTSDGSYSPITMSGIVSDDTTGVTSTQMPVAFELRTPYRTIDGTRLNVIVALGKDVSVNFILSNAWMKAARAVMDYGNNTLRVPFTDKDNSFALN